MAVLKDFEIEPTSMDGISIVPEDNTLALIYDGECPVCNAYCRVVALRQLSGDVEILNARTEHPLVQHLIDQGYDLDEGMVMIVGQNIYHGADAIWVLSSLTADRSIMNRLNYFVFKSRRIATLIYPILKLGRRILLLLLGRKKISEARLR